MTTLSLRPATPNKITNFKIVPSIGGSTLIWDATDNPRDQYEIWYHTTNVIGSATLLATVETNTYVITNLPTNNFWFWVRLKNEFGVLGPFATPWTYGANFNTLYAGVYELPVSGTVTTSVNYLQVQVWYTTAAGVATSVGPSYFTTAVINSDIGATSWTNPDNARVNDSNYATITVAGFDSRDLLFKMSDLGVPDDATVTGMQFTLGGQTTDYVNSQLELYLLNIGDFAATNVPFPQFTANNTDQVKVYGNSTSVLDINVLGLKAAPQFLNSGQVGNSTVTAGGTSFSTASSSPTIAAYDTWYSPSHVEFTAAENDIVQISMSLITEISAITSTGTQVLRVYGRTRLYDVTNSVDVLGGKKLNILLSTFGTTTYGALRTILNVNETFITGFRGLLSPGVTYRLYLEIMKEQASGSPAGTVSIHTSAVTAESASLS